MCDDKQHRFKGQAGPHLLVEVGPYPDIDKGRWVRLHLGPGEYIDMPYETDEDKKAYDDFLEYISPLL